eukprot:CAMPEP_0181347866 /NCGR_PEP_ID=MMETSP1101-20121128/34102_1 /TAXON_ID=46948 /ORGANISM="Rhodomonas abbreviata, Strain Caron Lab Isolate" /LENGTH=611 /DNA_ID=CAMNT_0023460099 /DNA_START=338 /DNA_END=2174 /DNA_ORIENTATION=+
MMLAVPQSDHTETMEARCNRTDDPPQPPEEAVAVSPAEKNESAVQVSNPALPPIKQGRLHKLSYRGKGWKERFVELTEECELRYSRSMQGGSNPPQMQLKGVISLDDADATEDSQRRVEGQEGRFPFILKISAQRSVSIEHAQWWIQRDYYFAAVSEAELNSWLEAIHHVRLTCEVEVVDRAYCLSSSQDCESPRALDRQYTFIDSREFIPLSRLALSTHNNMAHATRKLAEGVQTIFRNIMDGPPPSPDKRQRQDGGGRSPVWVLGRRYDTGPDSPRGGSSVSAETTRAQVMEQRKFRLDMRSRLWFTYRTGFKPIPTSNLTSDTGWGCMLRSGQMMLAQALLHHYLRRDWRLVRDKPPPRRYVEVLRWFEDDPQAMFSLHKIALAGIQYGRRVGQWFGPDTVCKALRFLWHTAYTSEGTGPCQTAGLVVVEDRCIYKDVAEDAASSALHTQEEGSGWGGGGVSSRINADYIPKLAEYLRFPQSIGFIGGRPRHSYYFVGVKGYNTYYLDPHLTQQHQPMHRPGNCSSFHCPSPEKMSLAHIDPSLALGFYCDDKSDFDDLCKRISALAKKDSCPILTVADRAPDYLTMEEVDDLDDDLLMDTGDGEIEC